MKEIRCVIPMKTAKIGYVVLSLLFCVLGGVIVARPGVSAVVFARALGAGLLLFGVVKLVGYWSKDLYRLAFQYDLAFGALMVALGLVALLRPVGTMRFFGVVLGVCVLADALFKIQIALDARVFGISSWWLTLALALVSGMLGVLLLCFPADSVTVLLGLSILAEGVLNLCVVLSTVKIIPHQRVEERGV